jgi:hypothetical protein
MGRMSIRTDAGFRLRASGCGLQAAGFGSRFELRLRLLNKTRNFTPVKQSALATTNEPRSGGM